MSKLPPVSEAEVRAAFAARFGMPLTGQMLPGTLPFYPTLPGKTIIMDWIMSLTLLKFYTNQMFNILLVLYMDDLCCCCSY